MVILFFIYLLSQIDLPYIFNSFKMNAIMKYSDDDGIFNEVHSLIYLQTKFMQCYRI